MIGVNKMNEQFTEISDLVQAMVTDLFGSLIQFAPKLVGAIVVLLIGWIIARVLQAIVRRSIQGGLESILERTGVAQALERTSMTMAPSEIVAKVLYWLVMILFVMAASRIVGMSAVSDAITRILGYIPSVLSAALVLAAGVFLARFVANIVTSASDAAGISYARGLGAVANTSIVIMVGVVTMEQLGVETQILITVITVTVAAITAGMALAFALGSRDVVRSILAGHYLRQSLPVGSSISVTMDRDAVEGVVEKIGPVYTTFRDGDCSWEVPNRQLLDEVIRR